MRSEKMRYILNLDIAQPQHGPASGKERAARLAFEALAGHTFSDPEWGRARTRLLDFVSILLAWHRRCTTAASKLPKAA